MDHAQRSYNPLMKGVCIHNMKYELLHLTQFFPSLRQHGGEPLVGIYLPDNLTEMGREDERRPCLIICPGGGYTDCSQREAEPVAFYFLPEGFNVFVLRYSVAPHRYPTQMCQIAALIELINQNAAPWHCDTNRIALMGFSAGGHLTAQYATSYASPAVRAVIPDSKPVHAAVLGYPVITAEPGWTHPGSMAALTGKTALSAEEIRLFSCEKHVDADTPPTFLWHTAEDTGVSVMNSLLYAQALAEHHVPFEFHVFAQGGHGLSTCDRQTAQKVEALHKRDHLWLDCVKTWLELTLKL